MTLALLAATINPVQAHLRELLERAEGSIDSAAAMELYDEVIRSALAEDDREAIDRLAEIIGAGSGGPPFASAREAIEAELEHYRLQLRRVLRAAGHDLDALPSETHVTEREIDRAYQTHFDPAAWDDLAAARKALDGRIRSTLLHGVRLPIASLAGAFGLDGLEWEILNALLAPAIRVELDRLSRAAWRDFTIHYPSAGFLAELLRPDPAGQEEVLQRLAHDARLRLHGLIREMSKVAATPVHEVFQLDPDIAAFLHTGAPRLAQPLLVIARVDMPAPIPLAEIAAPAASVREALARRIAEPFARILLAGGQGAGKRTLARALAAAIDVPLLEVDLHAALDDTVRAIEIVPLALRDARLRGAALYLDGRLRWDEPQASGRVERIAALLAGHPGPILFGARTSSPTVRQAVPGLTEVPVESLTPDHQPAFWTRAIQAQGFRSLDEQTIRGWVCQVGLTPGVIERAASEAIARVRATRPQTDSVALDDLREALRTHVASGIAGIASRVPTVFTWEDVILPEEVRAQIAEALDYAKYQDVVLNDWGFRAKLPYGRSLSLLFTGPPGTGKTMVAGVIARSLGRDLYRVDIASIVSKYIGETEKNLARVFDEAQNSQAVLLFDEADSLFGKRTEVKTSVDRYSNLEVNYLLQRIEDYPGVAILTTNLPKSIDEAFKRRLRFIIDFPPPDLATRRRLWQAMIPTNAPVAADLPFDELARRFDMTGGHIKNAVLKAAFIAAAHERSLDGPALLRAAYYVCVSTGKLVYAYEPPNADGTPARPPEPRAKRIDEDEVEPAMETPEIATVATGKRRFLPNFPFPQRAPAGGDRRLAAEGGEQAIVEGQPAGGGKAAPKSSPSRARGSSRKRTDR